MNFGLGIYRDLFRLRPYRRHPDDGIAEPGMAITVRYDGQRRCGDILEPPARSPQLRIRGLRSARGSRRWEWPCTACDRRDEREFTTPHSQARGSRCSARCHIEPPRSRAALQAEQPGVPLTEGGNRRPRTAFKFPPHLFDPGLVNDLPSSGDGGYDARHPCRSSPFDCSAVWPPTDEKINLVGAPHVPPP